MEYGIIVACTSNGGIGKDGKIPWNIQEDLRYFQKTTLKTEDSRRVNAVIMGRKTWESLPIKPLPRRINVVVSTTMNIQNNEGALVARSLEHAHSLINQYPYIGRIFVIGGSRLYKDAMFDHHYTKVYLTNIYTDHECNTFINLKLLKERYKITKEGRMLLASCNQYYSHNEYEQDFNAS
jgi:dihydrofolate reductase/thymidylate synthase